MPACDSQLPWHPAYCRGPGQPEEAHLDSLGALSAREIALSWREIVIESGRTGDDVDAEFAKLTDRQILEKYGYLLLPKHPVASKG